MQTLVGSSSAYSLWSRNFVLVCVREKIFSGFYSNKFIHLPVFFPSFMTLPQRLSFIHLMFIELCPFIFLEQSHFENLSGFLQLLVINPEGLFLLPTVSQRGFKLCEGSHALNKLSFSSQLWLPLLRLRQYLQLVLGQLPLMSYVGQLLRVQLVISPKVASGQQLLDEVPQSC